MTTINQETKCVEAVWFAVLGGKFILRKDGDSDRFCYVLDDEGNVIGSAQRIYANGYAVHTKPYAGYVNDKQIVFVD